MVRLEVAPVVELRATLPDAGGAADDERPAPTEPVRVGRTRGGPRPGDHLVQPDPVDEAVPVGQQGHPVPPDQRPVGRHEAGVAASDHDH